MLAMLERGEFHLGITTIRALQRDSDAFDRVELPPIEFLAASHHSVMRWKSRQRRHRAPCAPSAAAPGKQFLRPHDLRRRVPPRRPEAQHLHRKPHAPYAAGAGRGRARRGGCAFGVTDPPLPPADRADHPPAQAVAAAARCHMGQAPSASALCQAFCESLAAHMREVFPISKPAPSRRAT